MFEPLRIVVIHPAERELVDRRPSGPGAPRPRPPEGPRSLRSAKKSGMDPWHGGERFSLGGRADRPLGEAEVGLRRCEFATLTTNFGRRGQIRSGNPLGGGYRPWSRGGRRAGGATGAVARASQENERARALSARALGSVTPLLSRGL